jgi:hypothetical protein
MIRENSGEGTAALLDEFFKLTNEEIQAITNGTRQNLKKTPDAPKIVDLKTKLNPLIEEIAKSGESTQDWRLLRNLIIIKTKDVLVNMQASFPDCKSTPGDSFDEQMEIILQFLSNFEEK